MKFAAKQISKKVISCILALAVLLCSVTCVFSVFADSAEVYSVTYASPAIPMFVDKAVDLNNIEVQFTNGGASVQGDSITWALADGTDTAAVSIEQGRYLVANKVGIHKLTASADGYEPKNIYVVVNETEGDYDFYLADVDFKDGANLDDWSFYNNGEKLDVVMDGTTARVNGTTDDANRLFRNESGYVLFFNAASIYRYMVYNSDIIAEFADYTVTSSLAQVALNEYYYPGFITRGDFEAGTVLSLYYRQGYGAGVAGLNSASIMSSARGLNTLGSGGYSAIIEGGDYYAGAKANYELSAKLAGSDIAINLSQTDSDGNEKYNATVFNTTKTIYRYKGGSDEEYTSQYASAFATNGKTDAGVVGFVTYGTRMYLYDFSVKLNVTSADDLPEFVEVPEDITSGMYSVTYGSPAIPMFIGKAVDLDYINVQFVKDGEFVAGNSITWDYADSTDESAVTFKNEHYLVANKAGIYKFTATVTNDSSVSKSIYVVVNDENNENKYDFYLVDLDFTDTTDFVRDDWMFAVNSERGSAYTADYYKNYWWTNDAWNMRDPSTNATKTYIRTCFYNKGYAFFLQCPDFKRFQ